MRTLILCFLASMLLCLSSANLHARLLVVLQQQDAVIAKIKDSKHGKQMITTGRMACVLGNDEVVAKALQLQGQRVHILFYEAAEELYCADLRPITEQDFDLSTLQGKEDGDKKKQKF